MLELTPEEAVDVVSAAAREIAGCHADVVGRVPGREAERVALKLGHEAGQLNEAVTVLRRSTRAAARAEELLALVRDKYGDEPIDELAEKLHPPIPTLPITPREPAS